MQFATEENILLVSLIWGNTRACVLKAEMELYSRDQFVFIIFQIHLAIFCSRSSGVQPESNPFAGDIFYIYYI